MRRIALALIAASLALLAEPSVYNDGGGYGVTDKKTQSEITVLKQQVAQLQEDVEGLRSVINGLSSQITALKGGAKSNYVTRSELQSILAKRKPTTGKTTTKKDSLESAGSSALYSRGVRLVNQKRYSEAKRRFVILKKRSYKKAATYYYLGEIAYYTRNHGDAVGYYKISAEANENASYMDRLLLHTGLALKKQGDTTQAKRFFKAIIDGYPGTRSAKEAKKHL